MTKDPAGPHHDPDELRVFDAEFSRAHGPLPPAFGCEIGWQPSALTPVFYGHRDNTLAMGLRPAYESSSLALTDHRSTG